MYYIPLTAEPNQKFKCAVPVDGTTKNFLFELTHNDVAGYWVMKISNALTNEVYIDAVPLITGEYPSANLLEQYSHLKLGSCVIVKDNPDITDDKPNGNNLGTDFKLLWSDTL